MTDTETTDEKTANDKLERLKKRIRTASDKVQRVKLERSSKTSEINDARLSLEADGIPREAFDMALRYAGWDSNKRRGFDRAYAIVRDALDLEIEGDLFTYKDGVLPQTPPKKPAPGDKPADKPAAAGAESKPGKPTSRPRNPAKATPPSPAELAAGDKRKAGNVVPMTPAARANQEQELNEGAQLIDGKPTG